jgi:hypothetical protein
VVDGLGYLKREVQQVVGLRNGGDEGKGGWPEQS